MLLFDLIVEANFAPLDSDNRYRFELQDLVGIWPFPIGRASFAWNGIWIPELISKDWPQLIYFLSGQLFIRLFKQTDPASKKHSTP